MPTTTPAPGHTPGGGVLVGRAEARRALVLYEDPQCPWCGRFERDSGDLIRREIAAGAVSAEYRMRCFLGPESVRADNALVLAAGYGHFASLHQALFANQPEEGTGGYTTETLLALGAASGLDDQGYVAGVRDGTWSGWVLEREARFAAESPNGTPTVVLDGETLDPSVLYDPDLLGIVLRG
jgi:thioredoxin family protein